MIRSVANANAYRIIDSAVHAPVANVDQQERGQVQGQAGGDTISISDEAMQELEWERSRARLEARVDEDTSFAAEMAKALAYSIDSAAVPRPASVRQGDSNTYDVRTLPVLPAPSETIRLKRIALYEAEIQKGTPPAEIYHKLNQLSSRLAET